MKRIARENINEDEGVVRKTGIADPSLQSTVARLKYGNYGGASRKWEMAARLGSRVLRNIQSRYAFDCKPFKPAIKCNDFRRVRISTGVASFFHAAIP